MDELKVQGQTLHCCGVYLWDPVFTHGQLYVALSRTSSALGLRVFLGASDGHGYLIKEDEASEATPFTHNIVYSAVLDMASASAATCPATTSTEINPGVETAQAGTMEHEDLHEDAEAKLHRTLLHANNDVPLEPSEAIGAFPAPDPLFTQQDGVAELLKIPPSEWWEVRQRDFAQRAAFLETELRRDTPGASSSSA